MAFMIQNKKLEIRFTVQSDGVLKCFNSIHLNRQIVLQRFYSEL